MHKNCLHFENIDLKSCLHVDHFKNEIDVLF